MAEPEPEPEPAKKVRYVSELARERKRACDRVRARTRVNIAEAYSRWRELREAKSCKSDSDLASLLLDFYQKREGTWTPRKGRVRSPALTVKEESDCDSDERQRDTWTPSEVQVQSPQSPVLTVKEESDCDGDELPVEDIQ